MLKNIRYRVALHYIKKAEKYIRKGDFKSILKY